jgi:hypothetical protein
MVCVYFLFWCHQRATTLINGTSASQSYHSCGRCRDSGRVAIFQNFLKHLSFVVNTVSSFVCRKSVSTQNNPPSRVKTPQRTISFSDLDWCVWKTSTSLLQMSSRQLLFKSMWKRQERTLYFKAELVLLLLNSEFILTSWGEWSTWNERSQVPGWVHKVIFLAVTWFPDTGKPQWKVCWSIQYNVEQQNYQTSISCSNLQVPWKNSWSFQSTNTVYSFIFCSYEYINE